jgi:nucleoside-diphosphate-sugar epimerase
MPSSDAIAYGRPVRVYLAGASGVIGRALTPLLVEAGHEVAGMTRTASKAEPIRSQGATPVVCDVYDRDALLQAVASFEPDAIIDQLTDLPDDPALIVEFGAANSRIRRQGTENLLAAARESGVGVFVAQSVAWALPGDAGRAVEEHERAVLDVGGIVVRYGQFYGPGTYFESEKPSEPRIHVVEAARRTVPALDAAPGTVLTVQE